MSREANTQEPVDAGLDAVAEAQRLADEADELLAAPLAPGHWPDPEEAGEFLAQGKLDRVLALYGRAMRLDPGESAYPWNLATAMSRLGLSDLALAFMTRAVHVAGAAGEDDWTGPDAQLALAEVAIDAHEPDLALTALARARALDDRGARSRQIEDLLGEIRTEQHDSRPHASLAALLQRLAA